MENDTEKMLLPFEELDYQKTDLGEIILQRRRVLDMGGIGVYEVKLNDEYLMSSLFHTSEVALTEMGLDEVSGDELDIVVGGLGLGYTAAAAMKRDSVKRMIVVEALAPVIDWHERKLVPNGALLTDDPRCIYHNADFFALARGKGFDPEKENHKFDAILLDIDHTPDALLNPSHADFYSVEGMLRIKAFLKPNGVFALWSNVAPDDDFIAIMAQAFSKVDGYPIEVPNPANRTTWMNGLYIAKQ
jgi:spermidine synthase